MNTWCVVQLFIQHMGSCLSITLLQLGDSVWTRDTPGCLNYCTPKEWHFSNLELQFTQNLLLMILERNIYQILFISNSFLCDPNCLWLFSHYFLKLVFYHVDIISLKYVNYVLYYFWCLVSCLVYGSHIESSSVCFRI